MKTKSFEPKIDIPSGALDILRALNNAGFEAYVVGGCVRDSLLGIKPHDWDITTSATPDQVKSVFESLEAYDTGIKHGTITLRGTDRQMYEVTTFRVDGLYTDNRHPESVSFVTDVKEDLARRDFTMNAIAYNPDTGLVDPFGGQQDIKDCMIRCVGDPNERFKEDALRILRALRFSSVFNFEIAESTSEAVINNRALLLNVSAERVYSELTKLICGQNVYDVLSEYEPVITFVIPELRPCVGFNQCSRWHQYDVYDHMVHAVDSYPIGDPVIRFALLLHDIGKPQTFCLDEQGRGHFPDHNIAGAELSRKILTGLKADSLTRDTVARLVMLHDTRIEPERVPVKKFLSLHGVTETRQLLDVQMADNLAQTGPGRPERLREIVNAQQLVDDIIDKGECFCLKDLAVNGDVLVNELDMKSGREVGAMLDHLLMAVIEERIPNDREALMDEARGFYNHTPDGL